ncbi:MAG TPA: hypothetical protein VNH46_09625, partial [Gemmatimonadales bacterium]|nr:hypothetical protein [Gemmatimonadales bacterium]
VDSTQAYFVDGVHEAVISDLADEGLGVIARTSVLQYQHSAKPVRVIARELGVDALVEASLSRTPDSVTVRARLVDGRSEQYLWHRTYAASLVQVPSLALNVARGIARAIAPRRVGSQRAAQPERRVDPEVYDDYLKGRSYLHRPTYIRTDLETARDYFERAIARDSTYAPAWAGIASYWTTARQRGYYTPQEATPPSEAAAYKAVALDSTLAEAHVALATAKLYGEWDWHGAEGEFRRAIALKPDDAGARAFYAHLLLILHRPEDALRQMNRARELDPLDPLLLWINGLTLTGLGRYDDAIAQYRKFLARTPNGPGATYLVWQTFDLEGRFAQADSAMQRWVVVNGDSGIAAAVARGHRQGGYLGAVRAGADYRGAHESITYDPWGKAVWYATARDNDSTLTWLERGVEQRDPAMPYLDIHPRFNQVHGDPRFQALVKRTKLPS